MDGRIFSLNISKTKGVAKKPVSEAILKEGLGVEDDVHAGLDKNRQVSMLSWESIQKKNFCLQKENEQLKPGDFAENITTTGINLSGVKIGDRFKIGDIILEVSQIGKKCHIYCEIYKKIGDCIMPKEGIFASVLKGGKIKVGNIIEKI